MRHSSVESLYPHITVQIRAFLDNVEVHFKRSMLSLEYRLQADAVGKFVLTAEWQIFKLSVDQL